MEAVQSGLMVERVIGEFTGKEDGPLIIAFGGVHGNELAGIKALQKVFGFLNDAQPDFNGTFIGLAGNLEAIKRNGRYIDKDLNRMWTSTQVERLRSLPESMLNSVEDYEQKEILNYLDALLEKKPNSLLFLDLHTTSAFGGVFSIANSKLLGIELAKKLHVPVITGLDEVLEGTTLNFFDQLGVPAIGFEAGHHLAPGSVQNMVSASLILLTQIGCLSSSCVPDMDYHQEHLKQCGDGLPEVVKFRYRHVIKSGDDFKMKHGYENFQEIKKGEILATDKNGDILAPMSGMILMPLYQNQGEDGFFIVEKL